MNVKDADRTVELFRRFSARFSAEKEALITLDSKVGDSDLGLTMAKGFAAAHAAVVETDGVDPSIMMKNAGAAIARAAPSTMGTLMATGFLRGAKALEAHTIYDTSALADFWSAFAEGVAQRGKAQPGDKTVLDVLLPIAQSMNESAKAGLSLAETCSLARAAAFKGIETTKGMVAQHGKAAAFQDQTRGLQDAGGTVAGILIEEMSTFFSE